MSKAMMKSNHLSSDSFSVREAALPPPRYDVSDDHAYQPFAARGESLTIPESYEPPSVVRAYIRDFLTRNMATYNLTAADVTRLCQNWQHGTGKELVTYDVKTWRSLMGVEMGSILHSRVQDENASRGFWRDLPGVLAILIGAALFFSILISVVAFSLGDSVPMAWLFYLATAVLSILCVHFTSVGWMRSRAVRQAEQRAAKGPGYTQIPSEES